MTPLDPDLVGLWSIVPPLVAIVLALVTKEVISSLAGGIFAGIGVYAWFSHESLVRAFEMMVALFGREMSEGDHASMILFLALLGGLVAVITAAGGSRAYGDWTYRRLRSRKSASLMTSLLGFLIFVDDYFNCLTVGTVMRPVTDKFHISREKLAYFIDATAAPVCILAPISSWAATVISYIPDDSAAQGMRAFLLAAPMNLYALLTIFAVLWFCLRPRGDFGPMRTAQRRAAITEDIGEDCENHDETTMGTVSERGRVFDLVLPILALIAFSVFAMLRSGGCWDAEEPKSVFRAFSEADASPSLALGALGALLFAFLLYLPRRVLPYRGFFAAMLRGAKAMVPAIFLLTLAWSIAAVCNEMLGTGVVISRLVNHSHLGASAVPCLLFLVASALAFSTGASWGTFGILIPIAVSICNAFYPAPASLPPETLAEASTLTVLSLSAVLAGSVLGDHCSPIADTTVLASTGAGCNHLAHVVTQLPYVIAVGVACAFGYAAAGVARAFGLGYLGTLLAMLAVSFALLVVEFLVLPRLFPGKVAAERLRAARRAKKPVL